MISEQGKTAMYFASDESFLGLIAVSDTVKENSARAVSELHRMGIETIMLTGDNERTAEAISKIAGIERVIAGVLPDGKAVVIEELKKSGRVAMVGDGINDAPALTVADVGIAIGGGTDIAIDSADVVLVGGDLSLLPHAIKIGRKTLLNIKENLFWAFIYNIIGIPLAAGVFIPIFGWELSPMLGAAAMSLSSFCVVSNALRLNFIKFDSKNQNTENGKKISDSADVAAPEEKKGNTEMTKTMKIEGMMCPHCSGRVKKCLEALEEVTSAVVSHESGTAVVTLTSTIADEVLKKTVEDAGYDVLGIE